MNIRIFIFFESEMLKKGGLLKNRENIIYLVN